MTTLKQRHHLYLPDDVSAALEALGRTAGSSKSAVVAEALRAWIDRRAAGTLDNKLVMRLDRMTREQQAVAEKLDFVSEALGTFIQHQLTLVAHQPAFTPEAAHLGQQRFRQFIEAVGRKVARAGSWQSGEPHLGQRDAVHGDLRWRR